MGRDRPGGEPTEQATPKRLREARRRGQVARSRDLSGFAVFAAVAAAALASGPLWLQGLATFLRDSLGGACAWPRQATTATLGHAVDLLLLSVGPALGAGLVAAVAVGLFQVRPLWTWKPLKPELSRLNALKGLKQLVSLRRLVDLLKNVTALTALLVVLGLTLWEALPDLIRLGGAGPAPLGAVVLDWTKVLALRGGLVLLVVGAADYGLQRYRHARDLRMTKEEVKREHKESEGDPQHKAARKRLHQELSEHDMIQQVTEADLVVVNPTHLAVALRYDARRDDAPRVVARGQQLMAARIKEAARQARVPIFHDVGLARALHELEPGEEIPETLYDAVADLLRALAEETDHAHRA
jgi:type III secretion protein U